jgi:hypothetical protein
MLFENDGSIEAAGAEDLLRAHGDRTHQVLQKCNADDEKNERHPPCFRESPE